MKKITRISPHSLAKVLGALYGLLGLIGGVLVLIIWLVALYTGEDTEPSGMFVIVLFPLLYGFLGVVSGYLSAVLYNIVAKKFGGIEFEVE